LPSAWISNSSIRVHGCRLSTWWRRRWVGCPRECHGGLQSSARVAKILEVRRAMADRTTGKPGGQRNPGALRLAHILPQTHATPCFGHPWRVSSPLSTKGEWLRSLDNSIAQFLFFHSLSVCRAVPNGVTRRKQDASAGNRTRVTSMATMYSATTPLMLASPFCCPERWAFTRLGHRALRYTCTKQRCQASPGLTNDESATQTASVGIPKQDK
jgi:hypothetical protein